MSISKTRQKLVLVARDLFARKGLENTTMNDIAQASEKGRRTLYTYFRNKEEIYFAVIEGELEQLSERMDEVVNMNVEPEQKLLILIYTHLSAIKEAVARNGSLRAEFFRNIWMVEKSRKTFDLEEKKIITRVLNEGIAQGKFHVENVNLMAEILHYTVKGLEVPYIYNRLGKGLTEDKSRPIVKNILCRMIGMDVQKYNEFQPKNL
ncbi:transcriptional regulator, TetR family [gut metagenome]|uniref:Transcriptional regulator, TetR family n=1 Tax=gut metagenome TaxID=749906 RepID=J9G7R7_9ZZZZ